jgi:hypothetical protein
MEEITKQTILPEVEYRVIQNGIGYNSYIPQYRNKNKFWDGYGEWKDCTEQKYDGRDGDWYTSRFNFDTLEKATQFIEREIEKKTVVIYNKKSWFK